jgi:hypothetical protein
VSSPDVGCNAFGHIMHDITNLEELAKAVKIKTDFELSREFVFWDKKDSLEDLKLLAKELYFRRGYLSRITFFFVALLTNTLMFFVEVMFSSRWLVFEDKPKDILRQYLVGVAFLSLLPFVAGLIGYFTYGTFYVFAFFAMVIYGIALIIGLIKTVFDTVNFIRLAK